MKCTCGLFVIGLGLALAGCGPAEPAAPDTSTADQALARRVEFFGAAARVPGITWRASGLGVRIITPGTGVEPKNSDRIRLHYTGRLKDGHVFDDTRAKNRPAEFEVGRLIPGLAAGVTALKPGGHAEFFIPPSLGYGSMKVGDIPPVSGLIFDVELLAVNPEPASKP